MSVIVNVMVFGHIMKHAAQELSEKGRSVLTSAIFCGFVVRCSAHCRPLTVVRRWPGRQESFSLKFLFKKITVFVKECLATLSASLVRKKKGAEYFLR